MYGEFKMTERIKLHKTHFDNARYEFDSLYNEGQRPSSVYFILNNSEQILQDNEIVNRLNKRLDSISNQMKAESGSPNSLGIYRELKKIRDGK